MPAKFKESAKILVDRQSKKYKTVNYYMHATKTEELVSALEGNTTPKRKQAIRNELVRRKVAV
tara:strand:- start:74 stop:262 length:189 start_codon:yes stop_codon:yes gene_type:complete